MVYFIQEGEGPEKLVKIGYSSNRGTMLGRLDSLQTANGRKLLCKAVLENCGPAVESALHKALKKDRRVGEWFRPSDELNYIMKWADKHRQATPQEVTARAEQFEENRALLIKSLSKVPSKQGKKARAKMAYDRELAEGLIKIRHIGDGGLPV